ncbi:hypothetical protein AA313_de0208494 [Arthrobotrys entomopaga]|nr:hypothetical protein AA313_de0208494 [Arthrobotrys entomopaga]
MSAPRTTIIGSAKQIWDKVWGPVVGLFQRKKAAGDEEGGRVEEEEEEEEEREEKEKKKREEEERKTKIGENRVLVAMAILLAIFIIVVTLAFCLLKRDKMPSVATRVTSGVTGVAALLFLGLPYALGARRSVMAVSVCIGLAVFAADHIYNNFNTDASSLTASATTTLTILQDPPTMRPNVVNINQPIAGDVIIPAGLVWVTTTTTIGAMAARGGVQ